MNEENNERCSANEEDYFNIPLDIRGRNILTGSINNNFTVKTVEVFKATA